MNETDKIEDKQDVPPVEDREEELPVEDREETTPDTIDDPDMEMERVAAMQREAAAKDGGKGWDRIGLSVALTDAQTSEKKLTEEVNRLVASGADETDDRVRDVTSPFNSLAEAIRTLTPGAAILTESLKKVGEPEKLPELLKDRIDNLGISDAKLAAKFKEKKENKLSGAEAQRVFTTLTGGMKRITLWNSGFSITVKNISLEQLNRFFNELNTRDYQYGRAYGGYYYLFEDLEIKSFIAEKLLPMCITGSTYNEYRDTNKLLKAIKYQDFPVIIWALASLMFPEGTMIRYVCAKCGAVEESKVNLSKMRLNNLSLINQQMRDYFGVEYKNQWIKDEALHKYEKISDLEKEIEISFGEDDRHQTYRLKMRQASVRDFLDIGNKFNAELGSQIKVADKDAVSQFIAINQNYEFTPWIKSITLVTDRDGEEYSYTVDNYDDDGELVEENTATIRYLMDQFRQYAPDFREKVEDYILSTKISHIAFYYPECKNCHEKTTNGYGGYIPYDPMHAFFTLVLTKILRARFLKKS